VDETVQTGPICPSCQLPNEQGAVKCARCGTDLESGVPPSYVVTVDLRPGTFFHGRYEILGLLGRGGMGMVYKARDRTLDEVVAIKVMRPDFAHDPKMADRFKTEIKLARRVRHKNVCTIHDYGEERGLLFISMELIGGVDLKHVLREKGAFPTAEAYDLSIQVAEGLQAVHDAGILHRDLKTPNIMRDEQGVARLMDFGVAKRLGEGTLTAAGHIVGTPEYMSPEQAQGHKVDFRSDIYALGIVIYEIFTGDVPFRGETPISTILQHINKPPPLDGPQAQKIPPDMKPVLRKALSKDPDERYAGARELAEALRHARSPSLRAQPVPTAVLEAPTLSGEPRTRRSLFQPWLLALAPVLAIAAGVIVIRGQGTPPLASTPAPVPSTAGPSLAPMVPSPAAATALPPTLPTPGAELATPAPSPGVAAVASPDAGPLRPSPALPAFTRPLRSPALPSPRPVAVMSALPPPTPAPAPPTPAPRVEPAEPGQLQVAVKPWGEVRVDGRLIGQTPIDRIALPPGPHLVRVSHPLYEPWERRVTIVSGATEKLVVDFPGQGTRKP
jgi:serine/threonine protein kinase